MSAENDGLRGTVAWVHPALACDPLNKRNHIGVICEANIDLDDFYVDFRDDKIGLYSADGLLILKPADAIHENLVRYMDELAMVELIALTQVDLLVRYGGVSEKISAMQLLRDHNAIQALCTETLKDHIARDIPHQYTRE